MTDIAASTLAPPRDRVAEAIRVGDTFSGTWRIFKAHWLAYCGTMAISYVPVAAAITAAGQGIDPDQHPAVWIVVAVVAVIVAIALFACMLLTPTAISFSAAQEMTRGGVPFSEAVRVALRRSGAIFVLTLLTVLCALFGLALLIAPGVIVFCVYAVASAACVVEGLGPIKSMARSAFLTKGNRWRVLEILILLYVCGGAIAQLIKYVAVRLLGEITGPIASLPVEVAFSAITPVAIGVLYVQLRAAREGVDNEHIAKVFD
jgi:uncharacterized membrane protein